MSKHKIKRYDGEDGSEVEVGGPNPVPDTSATDLPPASMGAAKPAPEEQPTSFKSAFAAARRAGDKTFEYNGKSYTTEMAKSAPAASGPGRAPTPAKKAAAPYETPYDRMNRTNREGAAAKASTADETARLRQRNMPASKFDASKVDPNTLLPKRMAKGGSVSSASSRADGIATKGKTRGTMVMCGGGMAKGRK